VDIPLNNTYAGPFEHVGVTKGLAIFESAQKLANIDTARLHLADLGVTPGIDGQSPFEINTVNWQVDPANKITGTAKFVATSTHDLVKATLTGIVDPQVDGHQYRVARVNVKFAGGTGGYAKATGSAKVVAKLFDSGLSVGQIVGTVTVP